MHRLTTISVVKTLKLFYASASRQLHEFVDSRIIVTITNTARGCAYAAPPLKPITNHH